MNDLALDHRSPARLTACPAATGLSAHLAAQHRLIEGTPLSPMLEPRRVQAPPGYHSAKCVSVGLFAVLAESRLKEMNGLASVPTEVSAHVIAWQVIRYGVPVYFVQEGFARAVAATDLPHEFTLNDLHWPLPGMVVGFPASFMQGYLGRDTCYFCAANCDAGDYHVAALAGCPVITVTRGKVAWQFYAWADGHLESFVTSFFREDAVDETIAKYGYTGYTGLKNEIGIQADKDVTDRLSARPSRRTAKVRDVRALVAQTSHMRSSRSEAGIWSQASCSRYHPPGA
jgi:hypothetical protein